MYNSANDCGKEQPRSTQRREKMTRRDEMSRRQQSIALACEYGRYGYRQITGLLRNEGWLTCESQKSIHCSMIPLD